MSTARFTATLEKVERGASAGSMGVVDMQDCVHAGEAFEDV